LLLMFHCEFSKIAKPLASLMQKNQKYEWGREQEESFQTLKDNLYNAPILSLPDGPEGFVRRVSSIIDHKSLQTHMRIRRVKYRPMKWIELFSDFDSEIRYHSRKVNVVADALSRKEKLKPR
ncbi:hypothetical protein Tco_0063875, partial [Tanacetum coccineum]